MHPSHLTAFVDGFLTIGIPMQAKGATIREILIEVGERNMGSVGADAILCRVRGFRDLRGEVHRLRSSTRRSAFHSGHCPVC